MFSNVRFWLLFKQNKKNEKTKKNEIENDTENDEKIRTIKRVQLL